MDAQPATTLVVGRHSFISQSGSVASVAALPYREAMNRAANAARKIT
jgi:hypothetical protein